MSRRKRPGAVVLGAEFAVVFQAKELCSASSRTGHDILIRVLGKRFNFDQRRYRLMRTQHARICLAFSPVLFGFSVRTPPPSRPQAKDYTSSSFCFVTLPDPTTSSSTVRG